MTPTRGRRQHVLELPALSETRANRGMVGGVKVSRHAQHDCAARAAKRQAPAVRPVDSRAI